MAKSTFDAVLSKLRGDFKGSLPNVEEAGVVKRLIMSSPKLNYIFGGGFPLGRIVEIYGPFSGGKTTLSNYIGGQVQKRTDGGAKKVLYIDMEHAYDKAYAQTAGLATSDDLFVFIRPLSGEEGFTIVQALVETGEIGLIVWDSVASTPTNAQNEDEFGKACVSPDTLVEYRIA